MSNISIDSHILTDNPNEMTPVRAAKHSAHALTYTNVAFFNWGVSIIGKEIDLKWNYMDADEFDDLDEIYQKEDPVVFDPQMGDGATYNVHVTEFDGTLFRKTSGTGAFRTNVKMTLLIMSEIT